VYGVNYFKAIIQPTEAQSERKKVTLHDLNTNSNSLRLQQRRPPPTFQQQHSSQAAAAGDDDGCRVAAAAVTSSSY